MVTINYRDGRPFYEQVKDDLRRLVVSGALQSGEKLPSVRELAGQLAINPNTIQRAYRELEAEGYICSVPGRGSFVCERGEAVRMRAAELMEKFKELAKELKLLGVSEEELTKALKGEAHED